MYIIILTRYATLRAESKVWLFPARRPRSRGGGVLDSSRDRVLNVRKVRDRSLVPRDGLHCIVLCLMNLGVLFRGMKRRRFVSLNNFGDLNRLADDARMIQRVGFLY